MVTMQGLNLAMLEQLETVRGLEFVRCFENHVISVDQFQLESSGFFGNGQAMVNGTVLESIANLDRVAFKVLSADTV